MRVLRLLPLGPARIASTPVASGADFIGGQAVLGVPLPSTVLGALGAALNVRLSRERAEKDPLSGIGALVNELDHSGRAVITGPLMRVVMRDKETLVVPAYDKRGIVLVKLEALPRIARELRVVCADGDVVGYSRPLTQVGVALRDSVSGSWSRVVETGYTFRRGLTTYTDAKGRGVSVEFIYKLSAEVGRLSTLVRFAGEGRQAHLEVSDEEGLRGLESVTSLLDAEPGRYMVLSYWPLMPRRSAALYLKSGDYFGLEFFDDPTVDILGIPSTDTKKAPSPRVVSIGLGYSEVLGFRRPAIPALPPGTIVVVRKAFRSMASHLPEPYVTMLRAGYASLLKL